MRDLSFQEKYKIIGTKNSAYEGSFITAVKTTGIFCRPSCRAKKPNPENVEFFDTVKSALQHGYRPCKICNPLEDLGQTPDFIKKLITILHQDPYNRIKDSDLRNMGYEPSMVRRWFKKNHNLTFQTYQRLFRINTAYKNISSGDTVIDSAFNSGYESLSGFSERYKSVFGNPPSSKGSNQVINITRITTPLGPMFVCASENGLNLLEFTDRRKLESEFSDITKKLDAIILPGNNQVLNQTQEELSEYFQGTRRDFSVPLDYPGTDFQKTVWENLQKIPYGETRSYKDQAVKIGKPKAVRAVAAANGQNRIAIIIPCHRVIGSDGSLTGYGGGLSRKKWLLDHEKSNTP
jgi:AraC family transcriptional regulator of adaptative response/methylated-DNA-[protein]-cysteine methyltransferase